MKPAYALFVAKPGKAVPDPFCGLIIEHMVTCASENGGRHHVVLSDGSDRICCRHPPVQPAIIQPFQRQLETLVPFDRTPERTRSILYRGALKRWIKDNGLDVLAYLKRPVNMSLDVIIKPRVKTVLILLGKRHKRPDIIDGKMTGFQMAVRVAERGSGPDMWLQAEVT